MGSLRPSHSVCACLVYSVRIALFKLRCDPAMTMPCRSRGGCSDTGRRQRGRKDTFHDRYSSSCAASFCLRLLVSTECNEASPSATRGVTQPKTREVQNAHARSAFCRPRSWRSRADSKVHVPLSTEIFSDRIEVYARRQ
jgi:hypothetical protein